MKNNTCNYSDEWQPYIGDYDKFEYDIELKDGTIVENCYPNGGKFNSISDKHEAQEFSEDLVVNIRFSENPRFGINGDVSKHEQYVWLDSQSSKFTLPTSVDMSNIPYTHSYGGLPPTPKNVGTKVEVRTTEKIGRNTPCSCGSGKKNKKCCKMFA